MEILRKIDGAKYVEYLEELDIVFVWNGSSHQVNSYQVDNNGDIVNSDIFSVGDFKEDRAKLEEVREGIKQHIDLLKTY